MKCKQPKQAFVTVFLLCLLLVSAFQFLRLGVWQIKPAQAATATFGNTNEETQVGGVTGTTFRGTGFICPNDGTADSITVHIYCAGYANVTTAIWYNQTTFLAETTSQIYHTTVDYEWVTFTFASPPTLIAAHKYYLVFWANQTVYYHHNETSGSDGAYDALSTYPTWPASIQSVTQTILASIYCTYTYSDFCYTVKGGPGVYNGTENVSPYKTTSDSNAATVIATVIGWMNSSYPTVEFIGDFTVTSLITMNKNGLYYDLSQATFHFSATAYLYILAPSTLTGGHFINSSAALHYAAVGSGGAHTNITGVEFEGCGMILSDTNHVTIDNCTIHNIMGSIGSVISLQLSGTAVGSGYHIIRNTVFFDTAGASQIFMQEHGGDSNLIQNCEFYYTYGHSIYSEYMGGSNGGTTVTGCYFHDYLAPNSAGWHIKTPNNKAWNNTFKNWFIPFSIYSDLSGYQANNNEIYNNTFDTCDNGLWVGHDTPGNDPTVGTLIHNNTFISVSNCIRLLAFSGTVEDTQIYDNDFQASCTNVLPLVATYPSLIHDTLVYQNDFNGLSIGSAITTYNNTLIYNNTAMTGYQMLNLTVVGSGYTSPDGLGWQHLDDTNATVTWTPYGGYSRVDFSIDGVNQTTTTSPINIAMSADHVGIAYFTGTPPPVVVTITLPANTTYTTPTVPVEISASGGTIDMILWNCTFTNGTVVYANTVYTVATSMTLGDGAYIFNARANNTLGEWDEATVTFTVAIVVAPTGPSGFNLYFPDMTSLAFQVMPVTYQTDGGLAIITVNSGTLNGTSGTLTMYVGGGTLYFSSLDAANITLHSVSETFWFVNGVATGNNEAYLILSGVAYTISWRISGAAVWLLPFSFIIGMVGLASSFAGPMYAIYKVKKGEYYEGMRMGVIITALGFALTIAWLWSV